MTGFPPSKIEAANPASVPNRSPLRYPGGKTWLIPHIRHWLDNTTSTTLFEPFAGGATATLTAVMEYRVGDAYMVERDPDVGAFWRAVLDPNNDLLDRIEAFKPVLAMAEAVERSMPFSDEERAFRTLVLNRLRRGGILAPGASFVKAGEGGKGLASRWYADTLVKRILAIREEARRISFLQGDGLTLLPMLESRDLAVFADPPYSTAGKRLYRYGVTGVALLCRVLHASKVNFMLTLEQTGKTKELVRNFGFNAVTVEMKTGHHVPKRELVITRDRLFE